MQIRCICTGWNLWINAENGVHLSWGTVPAWQENIITEKMKIEEAILFVLAERGGGLRTEQIADEINRRRLHIRKDGQPVTSAQVYAVIMRYPDTFVKAEGRIMLMI